MKSGSILLLPLLALLLTAGCGDDEDDEPAILPLVASAAIPNPTSADPAVFFQLSPLDDDAGDDIIVLDLMVRMTSALEYDAVNVRIRFDPSLVQFGGFTQSAESDGQTYNPFGLCNSSSTYCDKYPAPTSGTTPPPTTGPSCLPLSIGNINQTGDFLLSSIAFGNSACDSYTAGGTIKILSLSFIASTVGTSALELLSLVPHDCEILNNLTDLGAPCLDGGATITATR